LAKFTAGEGGVFKVEAEVGEVAPGALGYGQRGLPWRVPG